jgi:lambda family phage portal protein
MANANPGGPIMSKKTLQKNSETVEQFWKYQASLYDHNYGMNIFAADASSADSSINSSLYELRLLAAEAYANNSLFRAMVNNIVGHAKLHQFSFSVDTTNDTLNDDTEEHINRYVKSKISDASGNMNFYQLMDVVFRNWLITGETFTGLVYNETSKTYKTRVRVFETEKVRTPDYNTDRDIRVGCELDSYGNLKAIYYANADGKYKRISCYSQDEQVVYQICKREYPRQTHGIPIVASIHKVLYDCDIYRKSTVRSMANASAISILTTLQNPALAEATLQKQAEAKAKAAGVAPPVTNKPIIGVQPGAWVSLAPGEDIVQFKVEAPSSTYKEFITTVCSHMCGSIGFSYEYLFSSFADSSSASAKQMIQQSQDTLRGLISILVQDFVEPVIKSLMKELVADGKVDLGNVSIDEYLDSLHVVTPPLSVLSYSQDIDAAIKAVDGKILTRQDAVRNIYGKDYQAVFEQLKRETEEMAGIETVTEPTNPVGAPPNPDGTRG